MDQVIEPTHPDAELRKMITHVKAAGVFLGPFKNTALFMASCYVLRRPTHSQITQKMTVVTGKNLVEENLQALGREGVIIRDKDTDVSFSWEDS